jgi:hypothetical protein
MLAFLLTWGLLGALALALFIYAIAASAIGTWRPCAVLDFLFGPQP